MVKRLTTETSQQSYLWDQSESYKWIDRLPGFGWAWEYARRNESLKKSWRESIGHFEITATGPKTRLVIRKQERLPLDDWGILYADDVESDAAHASVIWDPKCFHGVVAMIALPAGAPVQAGVVELTSTGVNTVLLKSESSRNERMQHLLYRDRLEGLQFAVTGADVIKPVHLLADADRTPAEARQVAHVLKVLSDMRASGRLTASLCCRPPRPARLKAVLQALDGHLAGAEAREIAVALFGEARVKRDWDLPGLCMRDQVRRAIGRGRRLMNGGYRAFLRANRG